ncbi:methyltransferase domain-containing protein [Nitratireductor basaltis]|uniref:Type 11 methyltransferase n=1 Tax=Nitratireductor basaltis TaxID=472175 RepID=A0A084U7N7_9HYPH|nr:methyltransferase domain-containing protein [Nitratireductor basaltis]KFB08973.1 Type 11 methyltransferase [Nitratireductor basaltis]
MQTLFDRKLGIQRKLRALKQGDPSARFLMKRVAEDMGERLDTVERRFPVAGSIFSMTDDAAAALQASGKVDEVLRVEASSKAGEGVRVAEDEVLPLETESLDLAVSLLALHEVNDLPGLLFQIRHALRPDGLFLGAFVGAGTLQELRSALLQAETEISGGAAPRVYPFTDVRDAGALLQRAGFTLPVADVENLVVRYDDMFALVRDLRAMGATSVLTERSRLPATRALFMRAAEIYAQKFADEDGRIRASFNIIWLSGWAPHESQQKPLKPGSAKVSLKSVLEK